MTEGRIGLKSMDLISMLVNVAGTEPFIAEYTTALGEKLIKSTDYDTIDEIEQIEFLKMKFGEQLLHKPEVMLKDISDSKRVNESIHKKIKVRALALANYLPLPGITSLAGVQV